MVLELGRGGRVAVTCRAGVNRSAFVAALALVRLGIAPADAVVEVQRWRQPDVAPGGYLVLKNRDFLAFLYSLGGPLLTTREAEVVQAGPEVVILRYLGGREITSCTMQDVAESQRSRVVLGARCRVSSGLVDDPSGQRARIQRFEFLEPSPSGGERSPGSREASSRAVDEAP